MLKELQELLEAQGTRHERLEHREAFTSQEEAEAAHLSGWSWAKVVVVKDRHGLGIAVLPACCTIDMDRLGGLIGRGPVELASVEDMLRVFPGCELGAIPPFGRLFGVPTFLEEALVEQPEITMPAGDHRTAIRMRAADYVRLAEPRRGRFAVHEGVFPAHPRPTPRPRRDQGQSTGR